MGGTVTMALNVAAFPTISICRSSARFSRRHGRGWRGGGVCRRRRHRFGAEGCLSVTGMVHPAKVWTKADARPGECAAHQAARLRVLTTAAQRAVSGHRFVPAVQTMRRLILTTQHRCRPHDSAATDVTGFGLPGTPPRSPSAAPVSKSTSRHFRLPGARPARRRCEGRRTDATAAHPRRRTLDLMRIR